MALCTGGGFCRFCRKGTAGWAGFLAGEVICTNWVSCAFYIASIISKDPIEEANRYLDNARQILSEKAGKEDGLYKDRKYVKMAGDTAYKGILVALDAILRPKEKGGKNVDWYKESLARQDRKALTSFNVAYDNLHLAMGYDGNLDATVAVSGLKRAEEIIKWAETRGATSTTLA